MREVITTSNAPTSPLYSQAVKAGGYVYVSGLVGVDATTRNSRRVDDQGTDTAGAHQLRRGLARGGRNARRRRRSWRTPDESRRRCRHERRIRDVVPSCAADSLRRQARCRTPRRPCLDSHDGVRGPNLREMTRAPRVVVIYCSASRKPLPGTGTVDSHHCAPPCAVGTRRWLSRYARTAYRACSSISIPRASATS
jgi:hypothetical protein